MHTGKIYFCKEERLMSEQMGYLDRVYDFKQTRPAEIQKWEIM